MMKKIQGFSLFHTFQVVEFGGLQQILTLQLLYGKKI